MAPADTGPPFTFTDGIDTASFSSMMEALSSNMVATATGELPNPTKQGPPFATSTSNDRTTLDTVSTRTSASPSSISNIAATSDGTGATATGSSQTSSTPAGTSAANNSESSLSQTCSGISCSPGLQAAIAVPVVVVVLALLGLFFFCLRKRRKNREDGAVPKGEKEKKKWSRHLRIFSFDTELLMGGRHSSTNSIRSRQTGSARSQNGSHHTPEPSVHSVEEVAPPYRDAISSAQPVVMSEIGTGTAAGAIGVPVVVRPDSRATAPPPYPADANRSAASLTPGRNPFSDSHLAIPTERSPFSDPPGEAVSPAASATSSIYQRDGPSADDVSTIGGASDAASIREAQLGRNASVVSRGRVIENVRRNS